jgi:hypothetical protein
MAQDKKKKLELLTGIISTLAGRPVEVSVIGGKDGAGVIISIVIDGDEDETTQAARKIESLAGRKFRDGGYDLELGAYFCSISE